MNLPFIPLFATAAGKNGENTPIDFSGAAASAHSSGGGSLVRTIVGLAIVLAVIFGLRWVLKQVKSSREEKANGNGLTPMASLPLGSNRSLHVVRAGREVLVVGSGEHGVTPVRSYSEEEARALGILEDEQPALPAMKPLKELPAAGETGKPRNPLETLRAWTVRG